MTAFRGETRVKAQKDRGSNTMMVRNVRMNCIREIGYKGRCAITSAISCFQRFAHLAYLVLRAYESIMRRGEGGTGLSGPIQFTPDLFISAAGEGLRPAMYNLK